MKQNLKFALCQLNPITGDFPGNFEKARGAVEGHDADIYVFPECWITNYASDDLFGYEAYLEATKTWLSKYVDLTKDNEKIIILGAPIRMDEGDDQNERNLPYNALIVLGEGRILHIAPKTELPNYDVFDDRRWFAMGHDLNKNHAIVNGIHMGFGICEDIWFPHVMEHVSGKGAEIFISINSSPYSIAKAPFRRNILKTRVKEGNIPLIYVNPVGGNDELVWDGESAIYDATGHAWECDPWRELVNVVEMKRHVIDGRAEWHLVENKSFTAQQDQVERYIAAVMGLRDYVRKNGFSKVVFGNSGGADSCLVSLMSADAFGPANCQHLMMPSKFTSDESNQYAKNLASGLGEGAPYAFLDIQPGVDAMMKQLEAQFGVSDANVAEENLQAQLRGDNLSWFSNKFGHMIISTGNKSEAALGYATLYGDMRGGYNPLKDLYKAIDVYPILEMRLALAKGERKKDARFIEKSLDITLTPLSEGAIESVQNIIDRPPSAELSAGQLDSDTLPEYGVLDKILWEMIDAKTSQTNEDIAKTTRCTLELVKDVRRKLRLMEYKRFQGAPGPKIHRKAFTAKDWRYPMTNEFKE